MPFSGLAHRELSVGLTEHGDSRGKLDGQPTLRLLDSTNNNKHITGVGDQEANAASLQG